MHAGQSPRPPRATLPGLPAVYVLLFADLLRDLGYDDTALLADAGLVRSALLPADARVSMLDAARIAERGLVLAGHEGLGFRYAAAMKITLHGSVGLLALSSATIRDAIDAATRFVAIRAPFLRFEWERDASHLRLSVLTTRDLGRHRTFVLETMSLGLAYMIEQLDPTALDEVAIHMPGAEPPFHGRLARTLPIHILYGAETCTVLAPAEVLDRRPYLADPNLAALAREQCEAELEKLFPAKETVESAVLACIAATEVGAPTLDAVAKALALSPRTLRRRLADEGVSYTDLVDRAMRERALRLLQETELPIADVAFSAGYSDASNFARAVRRWSGRTPREIRAGD